MAIPALLAVGGGAVLRGASHSEDRIGRPEPDLAAAKAAARRIADALDAQWSVHEQVAREIRDIGLAVPRATLRGALDGAQDGASHLTWMGVADAASGRVLAATAGVLEGESVSGRPWFASGLTGAFAGDVHDAVLLQRALRPNPGDEPLRLVDLALPLSDSTGNVVAVLGAHLDWIWILDLVRSGSALSGIPMALADAKGDILFSPSGLADACFRGQLGTPVMQSRRAPSFGWQIVTAHCDGPAAAS